MSVLFYVIYLLFFCRPGSVGVDTELIFNNETVLPKARVIENHLKESITKSRAFLGPVIPSSIIVCEFLCFSNNF